MGAGKANNVIQAIVAQRSILDTLEIGKWIVFHGVGLYNAGRGQRRERSEVRQIGGGPVAVVHTEGGAKGQAFLVGLPGQVSFCELVTDRLAFRLGRRHRLHAVDVSQIRKLRQGHFVPVVNGRSLRVHTHSSDRADISGVDRNGCVATIVVGVHDAGNDVGRAAYASPSRSIVAADAEVRAANDLEIVGQAGMADGEIVIRRIDFLVAD